MKILILEILNGDVVYIPIDKVIHVIVHKKQIRGEAAIITLKDNHEIFLGNSGLEQFKKQYPVDN